MEYSIEVNALKRTYKSGKSQVHALNGVSFFVIPGEVFGMLGPNGAGKTTLIKILTTLLSPSSGTAKVLGLDCMQNMREIRRRINFLFGGERSLYWRLSAEDNLKYFADLYLIPRREQAAIIASVLNTVGLTDHRKEKVEGFSKGMKQRLQIARSLLNSPEVLFLDEPSIGLDPRGARDLHELIRNISGSGTSILLTTHYMPEAEELCDRIAILKKGEIVAMDSLAGLRDRIELPGKLRLPFSRDSQEVVDFCTARTGMTVDVRKQQGGFIDICSSNAEKLLRDILRELPETSLRGTQLLDVTLEDIYLDLAEQ